MAFGTLTDHIYEEIRERIITGEFAPGDRLKELDMAKRFEASQTPVREAIARLAQEGFVQIDRYRGATVSMYSSTDFENLYDIRLFLELPAIRLAVDKIADKKLTALRSLLAEGKSALDAGDHVGFERIDLDFHEQIANASGNPYLAKMTRSNHEKIQAIRKVVVADKQIGESSQMEHKSIVEAITLRDANLAESMLLNHIVRTRDEVLHVLTRKTRRDT